MDTPGMSRKRKSGDGESSLNDTRTSAGVNRNLLKCLVGLTKHIIDVHHNKHNHTHTVIKLEDEGDCESEVTEHNITIQPHFLVMDDSLWQNISLLKEQTAELEKIYNTPQSSSSSHSLNPTNYTAIDNVLCASVVQHLSENSTNLTEQICNLITMYKSAQSQDTARDVRKCLSRINKQIREIPVQSAVLFNESTVSGETGEYLTAAHNLSNKLSVLIKKVSKLKKIYKKRVLSADKSDVAVKKRKFGNISGNEAIVLDDNDVTINNSAVEIANDSELNANSLDRSILEPYNSNYVHELLDSYATVTNNAKRKRKLRAQRVLSETHVIVVQNDEIVAEIEQKTTNSDDVVIQIESDDNSGEIVKKNGETVHGVLVENVSGERVKKTSKKRKKFVENTQEVLSEINENSTAFEETPKKTSKKKKKSVENTQEVLSEINENSTATATEETPKKTSKKKKKSVENTHEVLSEINENSTDSVSEETLKKTLKKKKKSAENSVPEENLKKSAKKKRKSAENTQGTLSEINENSTESVSEETLKKTTKKKKKSVENSTENTPDSSIDNTGTISNENGEKIRRKKHKKKTHNSAMTGDILNDILQHICAHVVQDNETESPVERHNESAVEKRRKSEKNKENISVNSEKVKRKQKIPTDQKIAKKMAKGRMKSVKNRAGKVSKIKVGEKKWKSVEFIATSDSENSDSETTTLVVRQEENKTENLVENYLDTTPLLDRKRKRKSTDENLTENQINEHILKKPHKKKHKSSKIVAENLEEVSSTHTVMVHEEKLKKKQKNHVENSSQVSLAEDKENSTECREILAENTERITEFRVGNCSAKREIFLIDSANVNGEIINEKTGEMIGNIQVEPWENVELGNSDTFSSVFKTEPFDEDDHLHEDLTVNVVPLTGCLQDEDLDERDQYLYLRELVATAKENTQLGEETKDRLRSLCVLLDFPVPETHEIENHLCKGPTREQAQQMAALGVKSGRLTRDEDEIIRRNWATFCRVHDLPNDPTPFLALQHGQEKIISYADRRRFVQYLGKDLPHRALHSIYRRFKILFKATKDGRFSQDEDLLILSYVKFCGNSTKFADLMPVLNRSRTALETRYRVLTKGLNRIAWDLNLKAEMLKHMQQVMDLKNVRQLQHADITHAHLAEVARRMDLPVVKIRHQWCTKLYTQLFATKPLYLDQMKVDLVDRLYELKLDDWRKVNWCEVANAFPGVSPVSLRVLMKTLYRHNCPRKLQADLGAIINHCRTITIPALMSRPDFNQRYISRLKLKQDGGLREYC